MFKLNDSQLNITNFNVTNLDSDLSHTLFNLKNSQMIIKDSFLTKVRSYRNEPIGVFINSNITVNGLAL